MADDKVMIIMTCGPDTPRRCATRFLCQPGAAMEYDVTMFFTIDAHYCSKKEWLRPFSPKKAANRSVDSCKMLSKLV